MSKYKYLITAFICMILLSLCSCAGGGQNGIPAPPAPSPGQSEAPAAAPGASPATPPPQVETSPETPPIASGQVIITFDYVKQSGAASNQFAVWIEDMYGNFVKTLFATRWTTNGGYKNRPDSIALWVERSGLASMTKAEIDAISGASPRTDALNFVWDLTDAKDNAVSPGAYRFFVEGTLRWKNYVLYSGVIEVGDAAVTVAAEAEYIYEASDKYAALTSDSPENAMIGAVTASFVLTE